NISVTSASGRICSSVSSKASPSRGPCCTSCPQERRISPSSFPHSPASPERRICFTLSIFIFLQRIGFLAIILPYFGKNSKTGNLIFSDFQAIFAPSPHFLFSRQQAIFPACSFRFFSRHQSFSSPLFRKN